MEEEEVEEESCSPLRIPRYAQLLPNLERKVRLWCNPRLPAQRSMSFSSREQIKDTLSGTQISDLYVVLPIALSQDSHPITIESNDLSEPLPSQLANSQRAAVLANPLSSPTSVPSRASKLEDRISQNATVLKHLLNQPSHLSTAAEESQA
jgi:hypothetical protein